MTGIGESIRQKAVIAEALRESYKGLGYLEVVGDPTVITQKTQMRW